MDHQCVLTGSPFEWYKRLTWYLRTIMNSLFSRYSSMTYFLSTSRWNRWRRHLTRSGPSVGSSLQDDGKRSVSYHTDLRTWKKVRCYYKSQVVGKNGLFLSQKTLSIRRRRYSWLPITGTLANSNQCRFPLDFPLTFTVMLPSVTRTLDISK